MQSIIPKQYLDLAGQPVMQWSLEAMLVHDAVQGCVLALGRDDPWWSRMAPRTAKPIHTVTGGAERFHSVFNALSFLLDRIAPDSWVLVHDAVRPCVSRQDIDQLLARGMTGPHGALLACPVRDTLKRETGAGAVMATVSRAGLWQAMTPQLFPLRQLHQALKTVMLKNLPVTDEAQAMEHAGFHPLLVEGQSTNLKITRPGDLPLAESILRSLYPAAGGGVCSG